MDMLKQTRVRFSGFGQDSQQDPKGTRERTVPLQKTSSFKEDRKKQQNWFQKQFYRQPSRDYDSSDGGEYATAVAAAAFAINSLEEAGLEDKKMIREGSEKFPTKIPSKKEEGKALQLDTGKISRRFTSKQSREDETLPEIGSGGKSQRVDQRTPQKVPSRVSTTKRTPTTTEEVDAQPRPLPPLPARQTLHVAGDDKWTGSSTRTGPQSKADAWMEAQMTKIRSRYEKMNSTILSWENEKKKKAKHQLTMKESELEKKRAKALQNFRDQMTRIDNIVGSARAQVEERRKNDELKVKEKANKIRETGKVPSTCFCF